MTIHQNIYIHLVIKIPYMAASIPPTITVFIWNGNDMFVDDFKTPPNPSPIADVSASMSVPQTPLPIISLRDELNTYNRLGKTTIGKFVTNRLCDPNGIDNCYPVGTNYIKNGWKRNSLCFLFLLTDVILGNYEPIGFIIGKPKREKKGGGAGEAAPSKVAGKLSYYIDVIVADKKYGIGNRMVDYVLQYMTQTLNIENLTLSALPHVLGYYPRLGFQHRDSCYENAYIEETPQEIINFARTHGKAKALLRDSGPIFRANGIDYAIYEPFRRHIANLHKSGFNSDTKPQCKDPNLSIDDINVLNCHSNGFKMRKCSKILDDPTGTGTILFPDTPYSRRVIKRRGRAVP